MEGRRNGHRDWRKQGRACAQSSLSNLRLTIYAAFRTWKRCVNRNLRVLSSRSSTFPTGSELRLELFSAFRAGPCGSLGLRREPILFNLKRLGLARVIIYPQFRHGLGHGNPSSQLGPKFIIDSARDARVIKNVFQLAHDDQVCGCEDEFHDVSMPLYQSK